MHISWWNYYGWVFHYCETFYNGDDDKEAKVINVALIKSRSRKDSLRKIKQKFDVKTEIFAQVTFVVSALLVYINISLF